MKGYPDALDKQLKEIPRWNSTLITIRTEATVGTA